MIFSSPRSGLAARSPFALAVLAAFSATPAFAQTDTAGTLPPVLVSASRFDSDAAFAPLGASVITAAQIRQAGVGNVNEAIRKIGGVYGRQNLIGTADAPLDLRGFGVNSDQNVVVMVDGIRLSENELVSAVLSGIPIDSVERIEIVRGGSSVLYGEGATGGTIQIITRRGAAAGTHGSLVLEAGNQHRRELRGSVAQGWDGFSIDASVGSLRSDNYRDNNDVKQENFSGGLQWAGQDVKAGVRVDVARQDARLPGALTLEQFRQDPTQSNFPLDYGSVDTERYTLFVQRRVGNIELAADLAQREKTSRSRYLLGAENVMDSRVTQFSPRLRHLSEQGSVRNEFVAGFDFADSRRAARFGGATSADVGTQESTAIYARDEIRIDRARIALGARHETFDQDLRGAFSGYDQSLSLNAWELQGAYDFTPAFTVFAKVGKSYRVANVDENGATLTGELLDPQRSQDLELGATFGDDQQKVTAKLFRHRLNNEIFYDPTVGAFGANVNLDRTRRQGIEIEARTRLSQAFTLSAFLQHVQAEFTDGANAGRDMVLVPKNTATLRLNWLPGTGHSADVGVQWVGSQRYGGDFSNTCSSSIPSFATVDARYAVRAGAWEFAVAGSNLADKDYFTNAFGVCRSGIYPDSGRALKLTARMDF